MAKAAAYVERDVQFTHLPPLELRVTLPDRYPIESPPIVKLSASQGWLPQSKLDELEQDVISVWEDYGRCQILFAYIDHLQQAAESGFDLNQLEAGCLVLSLDMLSPLIDFDAATSLDIFNAGTYDCGICLEPKKGISCFEMKKCGHIFCKQCLQDFYNSAITEGDVAGVRCLSPDCGKETANGRKRKRNAERTLHPRELFAIGIDEAMVRRFVEMRRKKKLEADKATVYCPRTWCQGAAKSDKYPKIPKDLRDYALDESSSEDDGDDAGEDGAAIKQKSKAADKKADPSDRLAVCEQCNLAFCRVCYMGWHGPFARCFPRDPNELSKEEKASYDYIRMNTSPCPTCSSPTQKTMGCNHMKCFQCNTHFCYLCGSWLDGQNPYQHFNKSGTPCYQRLWELEEGDEGQGLADGRGFGGGRGWEQIALEAAREADEREAEEARARAAETGQAERREEQANRPPAALDEFDAPVDPMEFELVDEDVQAALEEMHLGDRAGDREQPAQQRQPQQRAARGRRNPFLQAPAPGQAERAQAVRNHERNRGHGARGGHMGLNANVHGRRRRQDWDEEDADAFG